MEAHPEGGFFAETYRSKEIICADCLPEPIKEDRTLSTSIYFLINAGGFSAFHRLKSDEHWFFHDGSGIIIYVIASNGELSTLNLGLNPISGFHPYVTIPAGNWFAAEAKQPGFGLVSCLVAPGFDFDDFELGKAKELTARYPQHQKLINRLSAR